VTKAADFVIEGRVATLAGESGWGWAEGIAIAGGYRAATAIMEGR